MSVRCGVDDEVRSGRPRPPCPVIPLLRRQPRPRGDDRSRADRDSGNYTGVLHEKRVQLRTPSRPKMVERNDALNSVHRLDPTYPIRARYGDWELELTTVEQLVAIIDACRSLGEVPKARMLSSDGPVETSAGPGDATGMRREWRHDDVERYLDLCTQSGAQLLRYLALAKDAVITTSRLADGASLNRNSIGAVGRALVIKAKQHFRAHRMPLEIRGTKNKRLIELDAQFKDAAKDYFGAANQP